ncbi:MAG TPA: DUF5677 domain-containing protein [Terriglobales bacterium]
MNPPRQLCTRSEAEHVRKFVAYAKLRVNEAWIYPPVNAYRYMVALALYSKAITVVEATLSLLDAGFSDEAFGMTRTLVDIYITLRYIANKDTEDRARLYAQFSAKNSEVWTEVTKIYWPTNLQPLPERIKRIAATYRSPHQWSGHTVKEMALEPDTFEVDPATGNPRVHDFAYRVIYRWTSHYVHPTIGALRNHLVQAGRDNFVVRNSNARDMGHVTVFNVACYVVYTMIYFYRCMGDPQPTRLSNWGGALVAHIARRHK